MLPVKVVITYCTHCHYGPRAFRLAESLLEQWPSEIESLTLVPSDGGIFDVEVDGELIFSKAAAGRHAEPGEVEAQFIDRIKSDL